MDLIVLLGPDGCWKKEVLKSVSQQIYKNGPLQKTTVRANGKGFDVCTDDEGVKIGCACDLQCADIKALINGEPQVELLICGLREEKDAWTCCEDVFRAGGKFAVMLKRKEDPINRAKIDEVTCQMIVASTNAFGQRK